MSMTDTKIQEGQDRGTLQRDTTRSTDGWEQIDGKWIKKDYYRLTQADQVSVGRPVEYSPVRQLPVGLEILERLFVGSFEVVHNEQWMQSRSISKVMVLGKGSGLVAREPIRLKTLEMEDENASDFFDQALALIREALGDGQSVLAVCRDMKTFCPIIVIAYLMAVMGWSMSSAISRVQAIFEVALNDVQMFIIRRWETTLNTRKSVQVSKLTPQVVAEVRSDAPRAELAAAAAAQLYAQAAIAHQQQNRDQEQQKLLQQREQLQLQLQQREQQLQQQLHQQQQQQQREQQQREQQQREQQQREQQQREREQQQQREQQQREREQQLQSQQTTSIFQSQTTAQPLGLPQPAAYSQSNPFWLAQATMGLFGQSGQALSQSNPFFAAFSSPAQITTAPAAAAPAAASFGAGQSSLALTTAPSFNAPQFAPSQPAVPTYNSFGTFGAPAFSSSGFTAPSFGGSAYGSSSLGGFYSQNAGSSSFGFGGFSAPTGMYSSAPSSFGGFGGYQGFGGSLFGGF